MASLRTRGQFLVSLGGQFTVSPDSEAMNSMSLSPQREVFAQAVASGNSQAEAYRTAYPKSLNWKPETVFSKASTLMADERVSERVAALRAELAGKALWSRAQSVMVLAGIAMNAEKDADKVRAVAELNRMHGFEAPQRTEITGRNGSPFVTGAPKLEIVLSPASLSDEELERIAAGGRC